VKKELAEFMEIARVVVIIKIIIKDYRYTTTCRYGASRVCLYL